MVVAWMTEVLPPLPENSVVGAQKAKQAEVKKKIESDFEKRLVALEGRDKNRSGLKFITGASFRLDDQLNAGMYLIKYQMVANGQEGCIDLLLVYPKDREHRPHLNMEKQQLGLDRIRSGYVDEAGKGDVRKVDYKLVKLQNGNHELHATVYRFDGGTSEGVASYIRICPP
jgi:hypothetical protein